MEIVFTSGGTESDNLAVKGAVFNNSERTGVVVGATEHEAVLEAAHFLSRLGNELTEIEVDRSGRIAVEDVIDSVNDTTAVVSVMLINNETGAMSDVSAISEAVHEASPGALVHTDAVQAFGCLDFDVDQLGVDLLSLTGHKFGGPKGAGLLYVREGTHLEALSHGGGQELGRRSGTHDVAGVVGLAKAMEMTEAERDRFVGEVGSLRDALEDELTSAIPDMVVNTPATDRSPHHLNVSIPGVRNETLLLRLDRAGVAASAGSACQSGAATVSHVLEAMGLSAEEARQSIRLSLGWTTTRAEIDSASDTLISLVGELR